MKNRTVCIIIYILTILDILFTVIGLKLGIVEEANPIMNYFLKISTGLTISCTLLFIGTLLNFLFKASQKIPWLNKVLTGLAVIKIYVLLMHIRWISIYLDKGI